MFKLGREGITFKLDYEFRVNIRILAYEAYVQNTRKHRPIFSRSVTIIITFHSACSKGKRFSLPVNFVDTSNLRRDAKFRISSLISLIKSGFLLNLARFPQIPRASLDPKINEWKNAFEAATLGKNLSRFLGFERERGSWTSSAFGRSALSFFFFFFFPFESLIGSGWKFFQNGPQNDSLSKVEKCTRIFYPLLMISRRSPPPSTAAETSMLRNIAVERRRRRREGMKEKISTAAWKWYSRQTGGRNNFQRFCEIPRNIKFRIFIRRKSWLCYYAVSRNRY